MPLPTVRISIAVPIENVRSFGAIFQTIARTLRHHLMQDCRSVAACQRLAYSQHESRKSTILCVTVGRPTLSSGSPSAARAFNQHSRTRDRGDAFRAELGRA